MPRMYRPIPFFSTLHADRLISAASFMIVATGCQVLTGVDFEDRGPSDASAPSRDERNGPPAGSPSSVFDDAGPVRDGGTATPAYCKLAPGNYVATYKLGLNTGSDCSTIADHPFAVTEPFDFRAQASADCPIEADPYMQCSWTQRCVQSGKIIMTITAHSNTQQMWGEFDVQRTADAGVAGACRYDFRFTQR